MASKRSHTKKKISPEIVFLSTSWGSEHGGINSLNYDICVSLAQELPSVSIACLVPYATEGQTRDALDHRVHLVSLGVKGASDFPVDIAEYALEQIDVETVGWWIAHDVITGDAASFLREATGFGKLCAFMHQSYHDYTLLKSGDRMAAQEKGNRQKMFFLTCDACFAVGPLLLDRLYDFGVQRERAFLFVPGIHEKDVQRSRSKMSALIMGRIETESVRTKGTTLAIAALAKAVRAIDDIGLSNNVLRTTTLKIVGATDVEETKRYAQEIIEQRAGKCCSVEVYPFLDRSEISAQLEGVNLCFMLSWHEGFGLVGWEAIGAGIPVIVSQNSGLFRLLVSIGGQAVGCIKSIDYHGSYDDDKPYQEADLEAVCRAIISIAHDLPMAESNADALRRLLVEQMDYTWSAAGRNFATGLGFAPFLVEKDERRMSLRESAPEYVAFVSDIGVTRQQEYYKIAQAFYGYGYYDNALKWLGKITLDIPSDIAAKKVLLSAEILLRFGQHDRSYQQANEALARIIHEWYRLFVSSHFVQSPMA